MDDEGLFQWLLNGAGVVIMSLLGYSLRQNEKRLDEAHAMLQKKADLETLNRVEDRFVRCGEQLREEMERHQQEVLRILSER